MGRPFNSPDVFRAIAHPVRRQMLEMLQVRPRTAAELAQPFRMTHASISEHIRALRNAGLINHNTRGPRHLYSLHLPRLRHVASWVHRFQRSP